MGGQQIKEDKVKKIFQNEFNMEELVEKRLNDLLPDPQNESNELQDVIAEMRKELKPSMMSCSYKKISSRMISSYRQGDYIIEVWEETYQINWIEVNSFTFSQNIQDKLFDITKKNLLRIVKDIQDQIEEGLKKNAIEQRDSEESKRENLLSFILSRSGKQYSQDLKLRHGPDHYDCSALVQDAYKSIGIQLPDNTRGYPQLIKDGTLTVISKDKYKNGDIFYMEGHVGLIGCRDGIWYVHESNGRSGVTGIDPITKKTNQVTLEYYLRTYKGAVYRHKALNNG